MAETLEASAALAARSRELQRKLKTLRDSASEEALLGSLTTRRGELGAIHQRLTRQREQLKTLRDAGAEIAFTDEFFQFVFRQKREYEEIKTAFAEDERSMTEGTGRERFAKQKRFAEIFSDDMEARLKEAWQNYVRQRRFTLDDKLLTALERIPTYQSKIADIRDLNRRLFDQSTRLPANSAAIASLLALDRELRDAWRNLIGAGVPDAVQAFFKMLETGAAPLAMVTEEVRAWMIAANIMDSFTVGSRERRETR